MALIALDQWVTARLSLARSVAYAKLAHRSPIEDKMREGQVLNRVRSRLQELGVPKAQVAASVAFYQAQIEASKSAQRAWQAEWRRTGAPMEPIPALAKIRVRINALDDAFTTLHVTPILRPTATPPREPFLRPAWTSAMQAAQRLLRSGTLP